MKVLKEEEEVQKTHVDPVYEDGTPAPELEVGETVFVDLGEETYEVEVVGVDKKGNPIFSPIEV